MNAPKPASNNSRTPSRRAILKSAAVAATTLAASRSATAQQQQRAPSGLVQIGKRTKTSDSPLKQQATMDYERSLAGYGGRLANPIRDLFLTAKKNKSEVPFAVVVIGSGYGSSIMAAKLSQHLRDDQRICILERGKEWVPGTFPDTFANVSNLSRANIAGPTRGQVTQPLGLFNVMFNDEVNVLSGSGLGGGSLINASIALKPDAEVFHQAKWPEALRDAETLQPYFESVARNLSLTRTPFDQTPKVRVRRMAAESISRDPRFYDRSNVSVMYDYRHLDKDLRNRQGMVQRPCTLCGDCINGCNVGAKNTLAMNYLPVAKHNGAEMYTQVEVKSIRKMDGYYQVNMEYVDDRHNKVTRHPVSINSKIVVVGAGSPASAGILLDSQAPNFQFSPFLGRGWSSNGDAIGFITDMARGTNIGGQGAYATDKPPVGPTVQSSLHFHKEKELKRRLLIQDAAIPRGVSNLFTALLRDPALNKSMVMLGMGHDSAEGRLVKKAGRWQIKWEGLKGSEYRKMVFGEFERLAAAHGGKYKRLKAFGDNLVTVHPLGGCGMSDNPLYGTTNHLGEVYDGRNGGYVGDNSACGVGSAAVHSGLYVADGSLMSTALGVNPFMTIAALSDRIAQHIVMNPAWAELFTG
ncbi:GMC family oxidoreductase N-terminal domain-containing protein [Mariniblastus fucicola]|uniref:Cholesterol oxidase n=1 Tax=Mariniblastus fucicola TaxID=980251 RepID=A0A5B9P819_9BACT|nr:GMC family oxidoreductase N-terminal domain-containing protein [Mariniblastus fucicola]QEG21112.1 Cholesterol oxidase precursor [Mariniblastus fucicola]